jgi:hypothetical protein
MLNYTRFPKAILAVLLSFVCLSVWGCEDGLFADNRGDDDDDDDAPYDPATADGDGDGISDLDEGEDDPDEDGSPNLDDEDSDGDGIADADEAGDDDLSTPPVDSDSDGTPDFLDLDSDDNGIEDKDEAVGDLDGDGILNAHDLDDDGDGIPDATEIGDDPDNPTDSDGDGVPDYWDADSDGDGILDMVEGDSDVDGDGIPNYLDLDSDGDGISDEIEGDGNVDGDGSPNFLDVDSDGDLISDELETANGTNPLLRDSDGDGSDDLIETALGTDPLDAEDNPANNGDLVFVSAPRTGVPPSEQVFSTTTNFQELDVYFLIDITCSMGGEISAMRNAVQDIIETLTCESSGVACVEDAECTSGEVCSLSGDCIEDPANNGCVPSFWSGVGDYRDQSYPVRNLASMSGNASATAAAIPGGTGGGGSENLFEAAECTANPAQCSSQASCPGSNTSSSQICGCASSGIGCPGYREGAVRVLVEITDENDQSGQSSASAAGNALSSQGIQFLGIDCDAGHLGLSDLQSVATAAGSLDTNGQPFVRSGDNAAVATQIDAALHEMIELTPMQVTVELAEVSWDDGDAMPFFDYLVVNTTADLDGDGTSDCTAGLATSDGDSDGHDDTYNDVEPNNRVCWSFFPSTTHEATTTQSVQTFVLEVTVSGNGALLDQFYAWWVVPPSMPQQVQ